MSERTVTIPLEEYEQLTNEDKVYRYSSHNGKTYTWYYKVPGAKEINEKISKDYEESLISWRYKATDLERGFNKIYNKLEKIPLWIRRLYGAE